MKTKLKKLTSVCLAFIMILSVLTVAPFTAGAAETDSASVGGTYTSGDFEYKILDDGTASITRYNGSATELEIPSILGGYTVKEIFWRAFSGCKSLKKVKLCDGLEIIGFCAFKECDRLEEIIIPNTVRTIDTGAFGKCKSLKKIKIPDSVQTLGNGVFYNCVNLIQVNIPNGVEEITGYEHAQGYADETAAVGCFCGCSSLTEINVPSSVIKIGESAFSGCTSLTKVMISNSVSEIGNCAFSGCTNLMRLDVEDYNASYSSIDGVLFNKDKTELCCYPRGKSGDYSIPESVTRIGYSAFSGCTGLTSIKLPNNVTEIGCYAFSGCTNLTNITIPDSTTSIQDYAFSDCINLKSIKLPNGTARIDDWVFRNCTALENITIPTGISFRYSSLDGFSIFEGCENLKNINVSQSNENYSSYDGVLLDKDGYHIICCPVGKSGNYIIPNNVGCIDNYAFAHCNKLTNIIIPESVWRIDKYAFEYCSGLTKIIIPENATTLGYYGGWYEPEGIFKGCTNLKEIEVDPNNLCYSSLDGVLFDKDKETLYYCPAQKGGEYIVPESTEVINRYAFDDCTVLKKVVIHSNVSFSSFTFSNCTDLERIEISEDNIKYSSVDGVLFNKDKTEIIFCPRGKNGDYIIQDGVKDIDSYAFCDCSKLESIVIPESIASDIDGSYFSGCTNLLSINVDEKNENYTSVDGVLFSKDKTVLLKYPSSKIDKNYIFPYSVSVISRGAFSNCKYLTSITLNNEFLSIYDDDFLYCKSLNEIVIPNSVEYIEDYALGYLWDSDAWRYVKKDNFTIYGYKNTIAEIYANENGFTFIALDSQQIGDVDGDGKISIDDVTDIQKYIANTMDFTEEQMALADVDKNGTVSIDDVTLIQKHLAGLAIIE